MRHPELACLLGTDLPAKRDVITARIAADEATKPARPPVSFHRAIHPAAEVTVTHMHIIMKVNRGFRPTQSGDPNSPAATFRGRDD